MSSARFLIGDVFTRLRAMDEASVDLVLTSPPFLALRSYLPEGHPDKHLEIGTEPTPAEFIDTLLALTADWGRVLTRTGSIAVELGDTYAGSGGAGGDHNEGGAKAVQPKADGSGRRQRPADVAAGILPRLSQPGPKGRDEMPGWPLDKSMCIIPHLYAASLAYGRNILTGAESPAGCWRVRNVVAWCRPNPAVGALGDKYRPATSFMVIATKARDRWFDLDAVRTPTTVAPTVQRVGMASASKGISCGDSGNPDKERMSHNPAGAPPLDHVGLREGEADLFVDDSWLVSPESYRGSHYATWPRKLLGQPILSMCPREVCTACSEPRRRIVEVKRVRVADGMVDPPRVPPTRDDAPNNSTAIGMRHEVKTVSNTVGWSHCGCGDGCRPTTYRTEVMDVDQVKVDGKWIDIDEAPDADVPTRTKRKRKKVLDDIGHCADPSHHRRGHVLDPFGGSGTTAVVATGLGRDCTLIDIDERNAELARDRVGMFLDTSSEVA